MLLLSVLSFLLTGILVGVSRYHGNDAAATALVQLSGLSFVLAGSACLMIYVARAARFAAVPLWQMLALAIALRVFAWCGMPLLENDFFRYLWDAYRFAT
ncbi:MAG: hypothetical protein K2X63_07550, partial [Burkholderiaceae bacterium]|nr:hypothetical protein [Burkholderiaceae bacterium]